jgi:hypothetical protein
MATNSATKQAVQQHEAPLTWTAKKEWGSEGNTHRASVTLDNGDQWSFVVDQPRKGYWVARGFRKAAADVADGRTGGGDMVFYRESTTMKDAKAQSQAHANLAQTSTCGECGKVTGHKLDCGTGRRAATDQTVRVFSRQPLRATDEGAEVLAAADRIQPLPTTATDQLAAAKQAMKKLGTVAQAASGPISRLVRALIAAQPCGCPTPVHRMSCGNGATPRVIRRGGAA